MNIVAVLVALVGLLFTAAYFTRRRFGMLGLALCAGFLLSTMWTSDIVVFLQDSGVELLTPPIASVVATIVTLVPAVALLLSGPKYATRWQRLVGAGAFALLAVSFLLTPLHSTLMLDGTGKTIYEMLIDNRDIIITAAIMYAVYDWMAYKPPKKDKQ
jgi:hypothetical protein